ncbi:hypothetical protein [Undibacterium luofuense]|uniref:hypothetical protein n=1 Tax=Undibacterium luofuense TaxID=2828733 RepID=UPI0030EE563E
MMQLNVSGEDNRWHLLPVQLSLGILVKNLHFSRFFLTAGANDGIIRTRNFSSAVEIDGFPSSSCCPGIEIHSVDAAI